jgi:hypothetical protein
MLDRIRAILSGTSATRAQAMPAGGLASLAPAGMNLLDVPNGTCRTYRQMRKNPTIALARAVATAPVLAASWSYEAKGGDDAMVRLVQDFCEPLRARFLRDACFAMDYGFKPFEVVWGIDNLALMPKRLKPLNVEKTEAITGPGGELAGAKNFGAPLSPPYLLWVAYDSEDDDPQGRSIYENIRETAYTGWVELHKKYIRYVEKVAGVIPVIEYPPGVSPDASGAMRSNFEIAQSILVRLGSMHGVAMPNSLAVQVQDMLDRGMAADKVQAWALRFIEASGQHGADFILGLRHHESLMMRGLLVPERTALEGQHGTLAEADSHADIALSIAQLWLDDLIGQYQKQVVDAALEMNRGPQAKGSVIVKPEPLVDTKKALLKTVMQTVMSGNPDILEQWVDVDAALDQLGLPKTKEIVVAEGTGQDATNGA